MGCFCMPKGQRKYNGAQKVEIIKQLHNEKLSFYEASSKYGIPRRTLQDWERIYLEEGEEALLVERRGRACAAGGTQKGRKPKLDKQVEEDLIAENQRLRMEIDYLKKLNALVLEEERQNSKHIWSKQALAGFRVTKIKRAGCASQHRNEVRSCRKRQRNFKEKQ